MSVNIVLNRTNDRRGLIEWHYMAQSVKSFTASRKCQPWDLPSPCREPCVDESSVWLKLQRHFSSLSGGCSFSLICSLLNASPEGHFDGLRVKEEEKFTWHFLGAAFTVDRGKVVGFHLLNTLIPKLSPKKPTSNLNSIKEGVILPCTFFLFYSESWSSAHH